MILLPIGKELNKYDGKVLASKCSNELFQILVLDAQKSRAQKSDYIFLIHMEYVHVRKSTCSEMYFGLN